MTRYYRVAQRARPRAGYEYNDHALVPHLTVYEPESPHVFSGLLDADGQELYRSTRQPIGFIHPSEDA